MKEHFHRKENWCGRKELSVLSRIIYFSKRKRERRKTNLKMFNSYYISVANAWVL